MFFEYDVERDMPVLAHAREVRKNVIPVVSARAYTCRCEATFVSGDGISS